MRRLGTGSESTHCYGRIRSRGPRGHSGRAGQHQSGSPLPPTDTPIPEPESLKRNGLAEVTFRSELCEAAWGWPLAVSVTGRHLLQAARRQAHHLGCRDNRYGSRHRQQARDHRLANRTQRGRDVLGQFLQEPGPARPAQSEAGHLRRASERIAASTVSPEYPTLFPRDDRGPKEADGGCLGSAVGIARRARRYIIAPSPADCLVCAKGEVAIKVPKRTLSNATKPRTCH